jgi:hypothetical protein
MYENKSYDMKTYPKLVLNTLKVMGGPTLFIPYLYPIGDLIQRSFHKGFHVCTDQGNFLRSFLINSELKVNLTKG